ncbi:MAG: ribosome small subunit-dependent GTPase A [Christensenella sp.]|nr:ribosome small subunit-dependent GTPase A [Christensenella sp.]
MRGRIIKGIGGFYYVSDSNGTVFECKARGRFRKDGLTPCVGDFVDFEPSGQGYAAIEKILPRANRLVRPPVANVDQMLLVLSAGKPEVDFLLCDKLLIQAERAGINPVIVINKSEMDEKCAAQIEKQYSFYDVLQVSAVTGQGIDGLKHSLHGKCVCLAGQSAVGKSSIINAICGAFGLETGDLSRKTDRGKHTTRQAELLYLKEEDAYLVDTPGFSMYDIDGISKTELAHFYPELQQYAAQCRFSSCIHDKEPGCAVKEALLQGKISAERYERYLKLLYLLGEKRQ